MKEYIEKSDVNGLVQIGWSGDAIVTAIINNGVSSFPAIPIPKGATNREMFRAVFGYEPATDAVVCNKEDWCGAGEPCKYCGSNSDSIGREEDWWDAPYKKEVEE